jgi:hypothetical protein
MVLVPEYSGVLPQIHFRRLPRLDPISDQLDQLEYLIYYVYLRFPHIRTTALYIICLLRYFWRQAFPDLGLHKSVCCQLDSSK